MENQSNVHVTAPWHLPAIIGGSLIVAAAIGAWAFYGVHMLDNVITVTGSAKTRVTSDTVKWRMNVTRTVTQAGIPAGYPVLANDIKEVKAFLKENGVADEAVTESQVFVEEIYKYNQYDTGPREFNLREEITVNSSDVAAIDALSKRISSLSNKGIFIANNYLEFYVSTLPDLRVSLLGDAVKDAKARAEELAKAGGKSVGSLKTASSGVVQVLSPNSIDISDYGQYDTQSIEKDVMVTARATFFVR
jgi:hypothetical protein